MDGCKTVVEHMAEGWVLSAVMLTLQQLGAQFCTLYAKGCECSGKAGSYAEEAVSIPSGTVHARADLSAAFSWFLKCRTAIM